jgi:uncharacterized protein (TIGR02757 family)
MMPQNHFEELKKQLDTWVMRYNQPDFIPHDPISIPHLFQKQQDIEIAGFFAAMLAWGQRVTIIKKCKELLQLMDNAPHQFILQHQPQDLVRFQSFKHRTFNSTDALWFIYFLQQHYKKYNSLESAFTQFLPESAAHIEPALIGFERYFFADELAPARTRKHIATPARKSTCKRLCMYLRWMVRKDEKGVDFGIWENIKPAQLICPCDVHVDRVARQIGLIARLQTDWFTALELTENLRKMNPEDPTIYDFALFGMGVSKGD